MTTGKQGRRLRLAGLGALLLAALELLSVRGHPLPERLFFEDQSFGAGQAAQLPEALRRLPIIDVHTHLLPQPPEALERYLDEVAVEAARHGVIRILVGLNIRPARLRPPAYSRLHDDISLAAHYKYPHLFVPMLAGFDPTDPAAPAYVEQRLKSEPWKGIGELDLRNEAREVAVAANAPPLMQIYRLAARYRLPVLLHYKIGYGAPLQQTADELVDAITSNPGTQFVLAHQLASEGMWRFPNVTFQVEGNVGPIQPEHASRTLIGSDLQAEALANQDPNHENPYAVDLLALKSTLVMLSPVQAARVTHRNAARLFSLDLSDLSSSSPVACGSCHPPPG